MEATIEFMPGVLTQGFFFFCRIRLFCILSVESSHFCRLNNLADILYWESAYMSEYGFASSCDFKGWLIDFMNLRDICLYSKTIGSGRISFGMFTRCFNKHQTMLIFNTVTYLCMKHSK